MDKSENLELPYIMPNQAQKHVTHNEAIRQLDALVQISVIRRNIGEVPSDEQVGSRYIIGEDATGSWAGKTNQIAAYQDGAWAYYKPQEGWIAWVQEEARILVFRENSWQFPKTDSSDLQQVEMLGINTLASEQSRFGVGSNDSFFTHEGSSHRLSINKASLVDTSSLIFKTNWTGHAEIGLSGNNDFSVKVTSDGENWSDSIVVSADNGKVGFPSGLQNAELSGVPDDLNGMDIIFIDAVSGDDTKDGTAASRAIKTLNRLEEIFPIGRRVQIRLLSDLVWDRAIRFTYPLAMLEIYGRNAGNTAFENRNLVIKDATNSSNLPGCFQMNCLSNVYLRNLNIVLDTSRNQSFLNYTATMGFLRTYRVTVSRIGSGNCSFFADGSSFVPSRHQSFTIEESAKGYIAKSISADDNPNDDWRYPSNIKSF